MSVLTANVLVAGVAEKSKALTELPIRLLVVDTGAEAIRCMKEEKIHTVVSRWDLVDTWDGGLLKKVVAAKPSMPTIAFIRPGDCDQEIAARSLGVSAVLSEDVEEDFFRDTVCQLLGISAIVAMKVVDEESYEICGLSCPDDINRQNL